MAALRCSICGLDWPVAAEYQKCPSCLEKTDRISNCDPMSDDDAHSLKAHYDFERFYEEWDDKQPPLEERCPEPTCG